MNAVYDMDDGGFLRTELHVTAYRSYTYCSLNPPDDETAMATTFRLHGNGQYGHQPT